DADRDPRGTVRLEHPLRGARREAGDGRRRRDAQPAPLPGGTAGRRDSAVQGRHPLLLPAGVSRQAGRGARHVHADLVRRDAHRALGDRLRRAVRPGALPDEGIRHRRDARGIPEMAGGAGFASPAGSARGAARCGARGGPDASTDTGARRAGGQEGIMSTTMPGEYAIPQPEIAEVPEHIPGVHPAPTSFRRKYIFSLDHKVIGKQYMFYALAMLVVGGLLAILVRWQLAWPGKPIAFMGKLFPEGMPNGQMLPEFYNSLFTMHATIMIFFAIMPILIGAFGNFVVPIQIGARDMAFPTLNMLSFWTAVPAAVIIIWSFFVTGGAAQSGWTSYAPLAVVQPRGQTLWLLSLLILGLSSLLTAVNFITTIINMRAPGMTFFRLPLTVWALFITAILLLLALPVLSGALIMMLFDRVLGTTFFLPAGMVVSGNPWPNAGGGQALLWQHLFWFFGHPEVYIMILPAMGITSEVLPVFARKPIFGYRAMAYSIMGIAGLGFIVWGHHMFQSGMNPTLGTTFMISTMVIAVPSAIKTF